jgi:hypothetical protein
MKAYNLLLIALFGLLTFSSCDDDDPEPENEEELITTLNVIFEDLSDQSTYTFTFRDLDGDGGSDPVFTTEPLPANTEFRVDLEFLNETEDPVEDITDEVRQEAEEHQIFFVIDGVNITHSYDDEDVNGNPLGVVNTMQTGDAGSGTLRVVLRHEPDKFAEGVSDGDITNAGGETDIDVEFEVAVE